MFTGAVIYVPPLQAVFGTAAIDLTQLAVIAPFPVIVWGVDELVRWARRRRERAGTEGHSALTTVVP